MTSRCPRCQDIGYAPQPGGVTPCVVCPVGRAIIEGRRKRSARKEHRKPAKKIAAPRHFQDREGV